MNENLQSSDTRIQRYRLSAGLTTFALGLLAAGCSPGGGMSNLSEAQLRAELAACMNNPNPSISKTIICQNIDRECRKRNRSDNRFRRCT